MPEDAFERFRRLRGLELLAFLHELHTLGVALTVTCGHGPGAPGPDGSRPLVFGVQIDAPEGVLTDAHRQAIQTHEAALIDLLEAFGERAGIFEYAAGLPRDEAERRAWAWVETQYPQEVSL